MQKRNKNMSLNNKQRKIQQIYRKTKNQQKENKESIVGTIIFSIFWIAVFIIWAIRGDI